jgi:hypothetical protein
MPPRRVGGQPLHPIYANAAALALWVAERARRSQQARARLDDQDEVFGKESWRRSGITDDAELGPETKEGKAALQAKIARLKQRCLAAGHKAEVIANYEREYPDHYLISYLEELLERCTMKQRLRRAGLD